MQITLTIPTPLEVIRHWKLFLAALVAAVVLASGGGASVHAAFPGVNGKIAFHAQRDGNREVYVMNADGTGQTNVTTNGAGDEEPSWSPDGTRMVFATSRDSNNEIYVMNADGSGLANLTNFSGANDGGGPSWSPDGSKVAFSRDMGGGAHDIHAMNANGSSQANLTLNAANDWFPCWSPDGTKIGFHSDRDGDNEIFVMNTDGSGVTQLTSNTALDEFCQWSPDGSQIAFQSNRDGNAEVYVMNANGTSQTNISMNSSADETPAWSPDGLQIAFSSNRDGDFDIYVMNATGTSQTQIVNEAGVDTEPNWQPRAVLTIENYGRYYLPKTCFDVKNSSGTSLFQVCDNDFAGSPAVHAACVGDGVCNDDSPFPGVITVELADAAYIVDQTTLAPNHQADARQLGCDATGGSCSVAFASTPKTRPWHPWDITGGPGGVPDGVVRVQDILEVVNHYFDDKALN